MPTYSFRCGKCGRIQDVVAEMAAARTCAPLCCGKLAVREYGVPQVRQDNYSAPRLVSQFQSLDGDPMKDPPPFSSRSEEQKYIGEHNRIFGTKFEY